MRRRFIIWFILFDVLAVVVGMFIWIQRAVAWSSQEKTSITFTITSGESLPAVAKRLADQNLIQSNSAWALYMTLTGRRASLQPGTFYLDGTMNGRVLATTLTQAAQRQREVTVVIREGLTRSQIAVALEDAGVVSAEAFLSATEKAAPWSTDFSVLQALPSTATLEGFLFPDTYRFFRESTADEVVKRMLQNFTTQYADDIRAAASQRNRSLLEVVTMASILEGELRSLNDRSLASDLYWRRVDANMAMNADATVIYAIGGARRTLTSTDLQYDSPYNTYKYPGLPPGPIGNPSKSALRAAATPTANDYWFYISAPDGQTIFATTLEEHNRNVQKYLR